MLKMKREKGDGPGIQDKRASGKKCRNDGEKRSSELFGGDLCK